MTDAQRTVHVRISGRVQGVGYRAWTQSTARQLGILGWVRNRRDGTVEGIFQGSTQSVGKILSKCWQGPPASSVSRIETVDEASTIFEGFRCLPTA